MMQDFKIVFMGTPDFAVDSLDILCQSGYTIAGVVTAPDKPAGRGQKFKKSPVKEYALKHKLNVLQPERFTETDFINELNSLKADLQVVVAFKVLPEIIWNMPPKGTINLHASLLPQYRGAAPINHALMNGESVTGVTTFFIEKNIDTGNILFREPVEIGIDETAGELHDRLKKIGAELVLRSVRAIHNDDFCLKDQRTLNENNLPLKTAPKISKEDCRIDWNESAVSIHNKIRGLSPKPTAFTEFVSPDNTKYYIKIYRSSAQLVTHNFNCRTIITTKPGYISIAVKDGFVNLEEIQLGGKAKMNAEEFLRGFNISENWRV